jgi:hypothetical protein
VRGAHRWDERKFGGARGHLGRFFFVAISVEQFFGILGLGFGIGGY